MKVMFFIVRQENFAFGAACLAVRLIDKPKTDDYSRIRSLYGRFRFRPSGKIPGSRSTTKIIDENGFLTTDELSVQTNQSPNCPKYTLNREINISYLIAILPKLNGKFIPAEIRNFGRGVGEAEETGGVFFTPSITACLMKTGCPLKKSN